MSGHIQVFHEELDATALVPVGALAIYEERGWVSVEEIEPDMFASNDLDVDEDGLDSDEDDIDQEDY